MPQEVKFSYTSLKSKKILKTKRVNIDIDYSNSLSLELKMGIVDTEVSTSMGVGQTVKLILPAAPSQGFSWQLN